MRTPPTTPVWGAVLSMHSTMQELDSVYVPRDTVTFTDVATISKIQALARGRIARRQRQEQEVAVVAIQVSQRATSSVVPCRQSA